MQLTPQTFPAAQPVRRLRQIDPATIEDAIPPGDALLQLPRPSLAVLVATLGVAQADLLLKVPDSRILAELKAREQCGECLLADVATWLTRQREARQEGQWAPARSKAFADEVLSRARQNIAQALRIAMKQEGIRPDELAKRCATSREAVASLLAGGVPSSLELLLRMAGAVGITVDITVSPSK